MALYDPSPKLIDSIDKDRFVRVYDAPPAIAAGRMEFGANNILISISGKMLVSKNLCKQRRFVEGIYKTTQQNQSSQGKLTMKFPAGNPNQELTVRGAHGVDPAGGTCV